MMTMSRRTILSTDRLTVTQWLPEDFDDLRALHSDPLTMRFIGYGRPDTHGEARSRLDGYLDEQQSRGWTKWRVEDREGDMIGRAGFGEVGGCRELAYAFRRDCGAGVSRRRSPARWWTGISSIRHQNCRRAGCVRMSRWVITRACVCWKRFASSMWTRGCMWASTAISS
ncbi:hypothetical protein B2J88_49385, partial [Rhodococcus sp. SRB_17]|nr:hypothetical protein [Rhodococcus sp. SRB_17]